MRFLQDHNLLQGHHYREARFGICVLGLLTVSLLAGCGGGGGGGGNGNSGGGSPTTGGLPPPVTTLTVSAVTATGLTATLSEPSSTVAVNGTLVYTLTLTNTTAATIPVHATGTPTAPSAEVTVIGPTGAITFSPVPGAPPIANGSLAPGQSISTTKTANGFAAAGVYSATAVFGDDTTAPKSVGPLTVTAQ